MCVWYDTSLFTVNSRIRSILCIIYASLTSSKCRKCATKRDVSGILFLRPQSSHCQSNLNRDHRSASLSRSNDLLIIIKFRKRERNLSHVVCLTSHWNLWTHRLGSRAVLLQWETRRTVVPPIEGKALECRSVRRVMAIEDAKELEFCCLILTDFFVATDLLVLAKSMISLPQLEMRFDNSI